MWRSITIDKTNEVQIGSYLRGVGMCSMSDHVEPKIVPPKPVVRKRNSRRPRDNTHMTGLLREYTESEIRANVLRANPRF